MVLEESYCSYEMSKKLVDLGFDMSYNMAYRWLDENTQELMSKDELTSLGVSEKYITAAPTLELANRWLREEKKIEVSVFPSKGDGYWICEFIDLPTGILIDKMSNVLIEKMCVDDELCNKFIKKDDVLRLGLEIAIDSLKK